MTTVRDLLRDADPIRHEPRQPDDRNRVRQAIAGARGTTRPMPRVRVLAGAAIAAAALLAVAGGSRLWVGGTTVHAAAVRFEARLAESTPTLDLQPVRAGRSTIYLHREAVVTNDDIAAARVVPGATPSEFHVAIVFTRSGAEKMRAATAAHIGRPLALMLDGEVVMAPTIRSPIAGEALLTGDYTKAEAERIAAGMLAR